MKRKVILITQQQLKDVLDYSPEKGEFYWKNKSTAYRCGFIAGSVKNDGYINIGIKGKYYKAHRLAWLYVYGVMPDQLLDHINGNRSDNRIANLRPCNRAENQMNCSAIKGTSAYKGVSLNKKSGKWTAGIRVNGKYTYLGRYETEEKAHAVYCFAAWRFFGEFARYS